MQWKTNILTVAMNCWKLRPITKFDSKAYKMNSPSFGGLLNPHQGTREATAFSCLSNKGSIWAMYFSCHSWSLAKAARTASLCAKLSTEKKRKRKAFSVAKRFHKAGGLSDVCALWRCGKDNTVYGLCIAALEYSSIDWCRKRAMKIPPQSILWSM